MFFCLRPKDTAMADVLRVWRWAVARRRAQVVIAPREPILPRAVVGVLPDGTVFYVPRGTVRSGPAGVCCHLCGFWFPVLVPHLAAEHGWERARYVSVFRLDRGARLEVRSDRRLPVARAVPAGERLGAGPGRRASASGSAAVRCAGPRPRRLEELRRTGAAVARRFGAADVEEFVRVGVRSGLGLAELGRRSGLADRWFEEHLDDVAPAAAAWVRAIRAGGDPLGRTVAQRWLLRVGRCGYDHPADYLRARRADGWTWARIAAEGEVGLTWLVERRDRIEALFDPVLGPGVHRG
jgi:hypothetical protein